MSLSPLLLHSTVLRVTLVGALMALSAAAHAPHDTAHMVALSPNYGTDGTIIASINLTDHSMVCRSTDFGRSWECRGLPMALSDTTAIVFSPNYAVDQTVFFSTTENGLWRTEDGGDHWIPSNGGLAPSAIYSLAISPDFASDRTVLIATAKGLFRSTDGGVQWSLSSTGMVETNLSVVAFGGDGLTAFSGGAILHRSNDSGTTWAPIHPFTAPMANLAISPNFPVENTLATCFGRFGGGVLASTDGGLSFAPTVDGLNDPKVNDVAFTNTGALFSATRESGVFYTETLFGTWTLAMEGFEHPSDLTNDHYRDLAISPDFSNDQAVFVAAYEGLHMTTDGGQNWGQAEIYSQRLFKRILPSPDFPRGPLFLGNYGMGLAVLTDPETAMTNPSLPGASLRWTSGAGTPGTTPATPAAPPFSGNPKNTGGWEVRSDGISSLYCICLSMSPDFSSDQTFYYAFLGLWRTHDGGKSWIEVPLPPGVSVIRAMEVSPDFSTRGTGALFIGSSGEGHYRSYDGGDTWQPLGGGLPSTATLKSIDFSPDYATDQTVLISTRNNGLWKSTDGGENWSLLDQLPPDDIRSVALSPNFATDQLILVGSVGDGLWESTDGGSNWQPVTSGLPSGMPLVVEDLVFSPSFTQDGIIFMALAAHGVFRSNDSGLSWTSVSSGLPPDTVRRLGISPAFKSDGILYAGTYAGLWKTLSGGEQWSEVPLFLRTDDAHHSVIDSPHEAWASQQNPEAFGVGFSWSDTPEATQSLTFHGQRVAWHAPLRVDGGTAEVLLDNEVVATIDLLAPSNQPPAARFSYVWPEAGWHTIAVRVPATSRRGASTGILWSDGFSFQDK